MYDPDITLLNCTTDRSLSIANDLESTFREEILADKLPKSEAGRAPKKPAKKPKPPRKTKPTPSVMATTTAATPIEVCREIIT